MKKIAVLFPGMGYTCDKPLLYYTGKLAAAEGYEIVPVAYGNFPFGIKDTKELIQKSFETAYAQTEEILKDIDWAQYGEILFLAKSIGTVVSGAYAKEHGLKVKNVLMTPLAETFAYAEPGSIAFHGTKDPFADTKVITEGCKALEIPLKITIDANHSLETGNIWKDLESLEEVLKAVGDYAF